MDNIYLNYSAYIISDSGQTETGIRKGNHFHDNFNWTFLYST